MFSEQSWPNFIGLGGREGCLRVFGARHTDMTTAQNTRKNIFWHKKFSAQNASTLKYVVEGRLLSNRGQSLMDSKIRKVSIGVLGQKQYFTTILVRETT